MSSSDDPVITFLQLCSDTMTEVADDLVSVAGAARLAASLADGPARTVTPPVSMPVVDTLTDSPNGVLASALQAAAPHLRWTASPRVTDQGDAVGLALINETVDFGELEVGILALGPHAEYPLHQHPPSEVYLVLTGDADWRHGGAQNFRAVTAGSTLSNNPNDLHAVRAGADPLFALWVLFTENDATDQD